jgi:capsular polysaccharide biosynthesis protein
MLKESTDHFPLHLVPEVSYEGPQYHEKLATIDLPSKDFARIDSAVSMLSGIDENYYHYLIMFLTKLDPSVFYAPQWDNNNRLPFVVAPDAREKYQAESVARLCNIIGAPCITLEEKACIRVRNLAIPMISVYGGLFPHPIIKRSLAMLEKSFSPGRIDKKNRKLYISRRDSRNRKLENEEEVETLVASYGFEIVSLTGMTMAKQIELFSAATHVIAPHGAGLTNIVFCKPVTNILEIKMLPYINWCFRRLAALYGLNYGCLWASATFRTVGIHDATYYLNPASLAKVLTDPKFIAEI